MEEGHEVSVAYQTSGSLAVSDEEALSSAEFAESLVGACSTDPTPAFKGTADRVRSSLHKKRPGEVPICCLSIQTILETVATSSSAYIAGSFVIRRDRKGFQKCEITR